jgi:ABC-2 type transport system permease protein
MFSPLMFPAERLPGWLAAIHAILPVQAMGEVIRGTLAGNAFALDVWPFVVLSLWCAVTFTIAAVVLTRRG